MKLYYTRGLPGSGKSTLAREMVAKSKGQLVRVNRDDLRKLQPNWVRGKFNKDIEAAVVKERDRLMREALAAGLDAISDDTNLGKAHAAHWTAMAKKYGAELVCIDFVEETSGKYVPLEVCLKQDQLRDDSVGKDVILKMWYETVVSKVVPLDPEILKHLPEAYIFDIDGTLAHHEGLRSPYEERYEVDSVDVPLLKILKALKSAGFKIIVLSGREGSQLGEAQTRSWLKTNGIEPDEFYMRAAGDRRKDTIVKKELYEQKLKFRYNIVGIFDDRPTVIRMWELEGLKVFKCGPGYEF